MAGKQNNPLVRVTPVRNERSFDDALLRSRGAGDPEHWEQRARAVARKAGVDENLPPRQRCLAIAKALGSAMGTMTKPNLAHMHRLLDAAERNLPWSASGRRPSAEEIAAAFRATGRMRPADRREAGEDHEEDAHRETA